MILKMLENHKNRKTTIRTACNDQVKASRIVYSNLLETVFRSNLNRMNFAKSHNPCLCPLPATKFLAGCIPHIRIDHLSTRICQGILTCPPSFRLLYTTLPFTKTRPGKAILSWVNLKISFYWDSLFPAIHLYRNFRLMNSNPIPP